MVLSSREGGIRPPPVKRITYMRRSGSALIAVLAACLLLQAAAGASSPAESQRDPEDSDGRLDIVLVKARAAKSSLLLTIRTAEPWRSNYIEYEPTIGDTIMARLWWEFDTDRDDGYELAGHFYWDNGKKKMFFELYSEERDTLIAKKVDNRTVSVKIPLTYPELQGRRVDLRAISLVKGVEDGMAYPASGERDDAPLGIVSIR